MDVTSGALLRSCLDHSTQGGFLLWAAARKGTIAELKLGNNLYEYRDYNTRLQPQEIGLGTFDGGSDKLKLQFTYKTPNKNDNNGNVLKQVITRPSLHFSPRGEAKCVRGQSGRGASCLARAGVLEQYVEHGKQA